MNKTTSLLAFAAPLGLLLLACASAPAQDTGAAAPAAETSSLPMPADIFGNPDTLAMSFGGYRERSRDHVPSVGDLKEDVRIMHALGIRIVRTYNTQGYPHAARLLEAIHQIRQEDPDFEFYVMVGAWIDCAGAWTPAADHTRGDVENNTAEINKAVEFANAYPDIVRAIAVGNEAMVHWAASYYVGPHVILKWVRHLQQLKAEGKIPESVWITSSDNFASWGGADPIYHKPALEALIREVDFVSMHTYPFHDTHYNSGFWIMPAEDEDLPKEEQVRRAMVRARDYAKSQYASTAAYVHSIAPGKPIHIGESGWATTDSELYGPRGSRAADEFKSGLYYELMREWTNEAGISLFHFEMFDEQWKDAWNPAGSENHFGLINLRGQAKYALWDAVDAGVLDGLTRGEFRITKTYGGDRDALLADVLPPASSNDSTAHLINTRNRNRTAGEVVTESRYAVLLDGQPAVLDQGWTYPSAPLRINAWEGTCDIHLTDDGLIEVKTGAGEWWGCALEMNDQVGEDLTGFAGGTLHFEIRGEGNPRFSLGFQTGLYPKGNQVNSFVTFGPGEERRITPEWTAHSIPIAELDQGANLADVTSLLAFMGTTQPNQEVFMVRNIWYSVE